MISASSNKPLAADLVVGVLGLNLLQRHFAVELLIEGHRHLPQAPFGVRPQNAEPAQRSAAAQSGSVLIRRGSGGPACPNVTQTGRQIGIVEPFQVESHLGDRAEGRQALFRVAPVFLEELADEPFQDFPILGQTRPPGSGESRPVCGTCRAPRRRSRRRAASRVMKLFCRAMMPNSRLRSAPAEGAGAAG